MDVFISRDLVCTFLVVHVTLGVERRTVWGAVIVVLPRSWVGT